MGYADLTAAKAQLSITDDADELAILLECDASVSLSFEHKAGYDVAQTPIWRGANADIDPTPRQIWGEVGYTDILTLPVPATSVTDVQVAGQYPETLTADDWQIWGADLDGVAKSVRRLDGIYWPRRIGQTYVTVTALWADGPKAENAPDAVIRACTFLAVEEYRMRVMSPAGEIGPDGLTIRPRNPWNYTVVQTAIEAAKAATPMPVF